MKADRKTIVLIVVLILLIISVVYRVLNPFVHQEVDQLTHTGQPAVPLEKTGPALRGDAMIQQFLNRPAASAKMHQNLFSVYQPPEKTRKKIKPPATAAAKATSVQQDEAVSREALIAGIREYLTAYTWYGVYQTQEQTSVFLAKNKLVLVAKQGDRIDGKFLIEDIQDHYLTIKALDLNETLHLDMREFNNE